MTRDQIELRFEVEIMSDYHNEFAQLDSFSVSAIMLAQDCSIDRINELTDIANEWDWDQEFIAYAADHFTPCQLMQSNFLTIESLRNW